MKNPFDRKVRLEMAIQARLKMFECVEDKEMTVLQVEKLTGYKNTTCRTYLQEMVSNRAVIITQEAVKHLGVYVKYKGISRDALNEQFNKMRRECERKDQEDVKPFDPAAELKKAIAEGRIKCNITTIEQSHTKGIAIKPSAWSGYEGMAGF